MQLYTNVIATQGKANVSNAGATATLIAAPAVSTSVTRVTQWTIAVTVAAAGGGGVVQLKDGAAGTVIWQADANAVNHYHVNLGDMGFPLTAGNLLQLVVASAVTTQATAFAIATGFIVK